MKARLCSGQGSPKHLGLPSRALARLRSSPVLGLDPSESTPLPPGSRGAGPGLLCSSPRAPDLPQPRRVPLIRLPPSEHSAKTAHSRYDTVVLTGAILTPSAHWAVSGDMRTCVIVMTEVLLALRRGGWVCCSAPAPRQWSGWNVHSAKGQTRSGARPGRLADKGDDGTRGLGLV